jgi:hypothetical protein
VTIGMFFLGLFYCGAFGCAGALLICSLPIAFVLIHAPHERRSTVGFVAAAVLYIAVALLVYWLVGTPSEAFS